MADKLETYRRKRDPGRTPEPVPMEGPLPQGRDDTFVIQEHHARSLHWDLRLERDGVLVSWAVPKGLPLDPKTNHLAVHTEDHPLEYASFAGEIPKGEYGGGTVMIWDRGTYQAEKWSNREVKVVLHGSRVSGRYVLFQTRGKNWMIHRMDPPPDPEWEPLPESIEPMRAVTRSRLPSHPERYAFEFAWGGRRALAYVEGGRLTLRDDHGKDITERHRWLRPLGGRLGSRPAVLDGEVVAVEASEVYICFDLLHLDGHSTLSLPYEHRRALLEELKLDGTRWQTGPTFPDGKPVRTAAREQGFPGIVAKRLDAPYEPGTESLSWIFIPSRS